MSRRLIVVVYTIIILAALPFARQVWSVVGDKNGFLLLSGLYAGSLGFLYIRIRNIIYIGVLAFITFVIFWLVPLPIERIHFVEYGILGWISWRAFGKGAFIYVISIGILDELIQGVLPNRVFDFRDICMNLTGGGIGIYMRNYGR